ncbi:tetratricopeptide repeat protein [bacterium]|nr:tetratricopeptide repeat protein [bacterium]
MSPPARRSAYLLLGLAAACGSVRETTRHIDWKAPPPGQPGAEARSGDQSEPRLEGLTAAPAQEPAASDALQRASALSGQAAERRAAGDLPGAIALQRQSLDLRRTALGPGSPEVAAAETNLAGLYAAADRYDAAEPLLRHALAIREQTFGADNRLTALSRNNLALLLAANGRHSEAELLYLQAIAVLEHEDANDLATVLDNYAALLDDAGRPEQAKTVEQRAAVVRAGVK